MRPMNLAHRPLATSSRDANTVPRSTFRAASIGDVVMRGSAPRLQVEGDQDQRRAQDDDEERREDAPDEREEHLDRRLRGLLLCALPALDPKLLRLNLEHLGDRDTQLLCLDDGA